MKLHLAQQDGNYAVTAYSKGRVDINYQSYQTSLIITAEKLELDWPVRHIQDLTTEHFAHLLSFKPEIVIIGSGEQHQFIHPKLCAPLIQAQIAVECMTTAAACRTYNILMAEGRKVLAGLIV